MWQDIQKGLIVGTMVMVGGKAVQACDTALLLTLDVSHSVDASEYRLQIDGTADALRDPEVAEALVQGQVALGLIQWSGVGEQEMSLGWARMTTHAEVERFAALARELPRAFVLSSTAPGDAVLFALDQFADVADCGRRIIDVSGDGTANAGSDVAAARLRAERAGVTINGVAIEFMGLVITNFYQRQLVTRDGFVVTARGHLDYPRAIRKKILREVSRVLG
jgi:Ca-activated chloride channel homolog